MLVSSTVQAQFGKRLGGAVQNAAENATVRKAEQKTEQAVNKGIDKATDPNSYKGEEKDAKQEKQANQGNQEESSTPPATSNSSASTPSPAQQNPAKAAEMVYAKSDFVPGDEIIFDDPMDNEKLGEFPSQWDLLSGNSEVVMVGGKKGFELTRYTDNVTPLMKNPSNYLGNVFTIEFDFLSVKAKSDHSLWPTISFWQANERHGETLMEFSKAGSLKDERYNYSWITSNGRTHGSGDIKLDFDTWHHIAISFNKRAWKLYINGVRVVNVPNVSEPPGWFNIHNGNVGEGSMVFSNIRIAKGAVPLYDRMMSDGKFITYGITFDVGKSTIKAESMGEINRIVTLMKENPDLKFSVEGHTDSTGSAAANQTLSDARSKAVVDKLVENGIAADRLKAAGKGQTSPIADNGTDEGKAKNRRVEFIKL